MSKHIFELGGAAMVAATLVFAPVGASVWSAAHAATTETGQPNEYIKDAMRLISQGELRGAVLQLKNALQDDPNNVKARMLLANIYVSVGNADAAEKEVLAARRLGNDDEQTNMLLSSAHLIQEKWEKALKELEREFNSPENRFKASINRGYAYLALNSYDNAERAFAKAREISPNDPETDLGLAQLELNKGKSLLLAAKATVAKERFEAAEKHIDASIARNAEKNRSLYLKGQLRYLLGDLDGAYEAFDETVKFNQHNVLARIGRARTLIGKGNLDDAVKDLAAVLKAVPRHGIASYLMALLKAQQKDYKATRDMLQQGEWLLKDYMPAVYLRALTNYSLKNYEQTVFDLRRFLAQEGEAVNARKILGAALMELGDFSGAVDALTPLERSGALDEQSLTALGLANMRLGNYDKGTQYFAKAAELAPSSSEVTTRLAASRLMAGQTEAAVADLEKALEIDPSAVGTRILVATLNFQEEKFDKVLEALPDLKKHLDPDNPFAENLRGAVLMATGKSEEARDVFRRILELKPNYHTARMNLAELELRDQQFDEAKAYYNQVLARDPDNEGAQIGLANVAARERNDADVEALLREASDNKYVELRRLVYLANYYRSKGDLEKAVDVTQQLVARAPESLRSISMLGQVQRDAGKLAEAEENFKKLAELMPTSSSVYDDLGLTQVMAGKLDEAERNLKKAIQLNPNASFPYLHLARLELTRNNREAAAEIAEDLIKRFPDQPFGDVLLGDLLRDSGKYAEATDVYRAALKKSDSERIVVRMFHAAFASGKVKESLAELQVWVDNKNNDSARLELANAYVSAGRIDDAVREYEKLVKNKYYTEVGLNNLASIYHMRKSPRAVELAEQLLGFAPTSPFVLDTVGWIFAQNGQVERGERLLAQAVKLAPQQPDLRYHYAAVLAMQGQNDEAKIQLNKALEGGSEFSTASAAKELLVKLGGK